MMLLAGAAAAGPDRAWAQTAPASGDAARLYAPALTEGARLNAEMANEQTAACALTRGADKLRQGAVGAAIAALKEAVRLAPHLAPAHHQLALALRCQGAQADARAHFAEARRLAPWIEIP